MGTKTSPEQESEPTEAAKAPEPAGASTRPLRSAASFRGGWRIVARKELADHLLSYRFAILLVLIVLTGLAMVTSVASTIRTVAGSLGETESVFLYLYTEPPERVPFSFIDLMGFLTPLLGLAFGFTAINSERVNRTLPRLVSQPIHRDDVITGKFAAGLSLIALAIATLMVLLGGYGIVQLGITPSVGDLGRLLTFAVVIVLYVGVWLALSILLSVLTRSAVTAVLAGMGLWLALTLFAPLLSGVLADLLSPVDDSSTLEEVVQHEETELWLGRLSPQGIYDEAAQVLNPRSRGSGVILESQLNQALRSEPLDFEQSLLLIWPQVAALLALTLLLFAIAFVQFLQQEVRA
jgi:ABC-2 type transport system permease protein